VLPAAGRDGIGCSRGITRLASRASTRTPLRRFAPRRRLASAVISIEGF